MRTSPRARVLLSLCVASFGIAWIASSPLAAATGTLDQSQEAQTDLNGTVLVGSQLAGQTFTAGLQGGLDQVDLMLTRYETPGSLTVEIRTTDGGIPTSQVIASGSVVDTSLDADPFTYEWVSVVLSPAAIVDIGTQYAIVVRDAGGAIFPTDYFVWAEAEFNPYMNGTAVTSVDSGATWFPAGSADFAFRTFVRTAGAPTCLARVGVSSSSNLQTIIDGAKTGDTIIVKGVCVGNFNIPGAGSATSLTLTGRRFPVATLDGNTSGTVVTVGSLATVTFKKVQITNGNAVNGGGIMNFGTVNLATRVSGNSALYGAGIYNIGTLDLGGNATVDGNTATGNAGGIYNVGTLNLSGNAAVRGNTASFSGGGIFNSLGTVTMSNRAQVNDNTAGPDNAGGGINSSGIITMSGKAQVNDNTAGYGGGILTTGTLTMSDEAQLDGNTAGFQGGGIYNSAGVFTLNGKAKVTRNMAGLDGGGIYLDSGTLVGAVAGVNVTSNIPNDIGP